MRVDLLRLKEARVYAGGGIYTLTKDIIYVQYPQDKYYTRNFLLLLMRTLAV
jgi:hypothetical protein